MGERMEYVEGDTVTFTFGERSLTGTVVDRLVHAGAVRYGVQVPDPVFPDFNAVYNVWAEYIQPTTGETTK